MTFKILDFNCALVTGGGGGIGLALSKYFISLGKKVIIAGRTESKLQEASKELKDCPYYVLDTGDLTSIPDLVQKIIQEHPDVDCLVNNAGVQRPLSVAKMSADEFTSKADQEIAINIQGPMHLIMYLLPHFRKQTGAVIMNVSSLLGFLPSSIINPVYNGSKAWQHFWSLNLRTQLEQDGGTKHIRVVEIAPPTVSTALHREREDPSDNSKEKNSSALSLDEFVEQVRDQLEKDEVMIAAGPSKKLVGQWYESFGEQYRKAEGK